MMSPELRQKLQTALIEFVFEDLNSPDLLRNRLEDVLRHGHRGFSAMSDSELLDAAKEESSWEAALPLSLVEPEMLAATGTVKLRALTETILEILKNRSFAEYELIKITDVASGVPGLARNAQILALMPNGPVVAIGPTHHVLMLREDGDYDDLTESTGLVWRIL